MPASANAYARQASGALGDTTGGGIGPELMRLILSGMTQGSGLIPQGSNKGATPNAYARQAFSSRAPVSDDDIIRFYQSDFNRDPDPEELVAVKGRIRPGMSQEEVMNLIHRMR